MDIYKHNDVSPGVVSCAVWLHYGFNISQRRCAGQFIEDLLAESDITVSRKDIRLWVWRSR